ncbi:MAG: hypothetical protein RIG84_13755, partial [Roseovarius sp.]
RPASQLLNNGSSPASLGEAHDAPSVYQAAAGCSERRFNHLQPMAIAMLVEPPDRSSNHVSQLDTHTHMGWGQKYTFNEVSVGRSVSPSFANKAIMLLPEAVILMSIAMIAHDNAIGFVATRRRHPLKEILKPFGNHLVGSKIDIILLVYVSQSVCKR